MSKSNEFSPEVRERCISSAAASLLRRRSIAPARLRHFKHSQDERFLFNG